MSLSVERALRKAKRHAKKGEFDLAAQEYKSVLASYPKNKRAIEGLKALYQQNTEKTARNAEPSQEQINRLITLYNQGKLQQSLVQGEALAKQFPDTPIIANVVGAVNAGLGRLEEAATGFTKAVEMKPDYVDAHNNLGNALKHLGKSEEAVASYQKALNIKPDFVEAHNNLGNTLRDLRRPEEAVASYQKALQIKPDFADAHYNLGNALKSLGKPEEAVASYHKALQIKPDYAEAHYNLGNALKGLGRPGEAVASYQKALEIKPDYAEAHYNLGNALSDVGKLERAVASYHKALQIKPDYAEAHNNLGNALKHLGKPEEAVASYQKALQSRPDYTDAHMNLSTVRKYQDGDPQIQQMLQLVERASLPDQDRMHLSFALSKAHDDIGDYDKAFLYLCDGNRLRKEELKYDNASARKEFSDVKSTFLKSVPAPDLYREPDGDKEKQPIFILGMPRSGTTLVEQILASHSQVYGAGELALLSQSVNTIEWKSTEITSDRIQSIRRSYFSGLAKIGASERYITDKMPANFYWIGFICSAIPEARIIHVKRNACATCWSNYKLFFPTKAIGFAYDLRDVAEYYKMYIDLMDFWHEKYPRRIYDLHYEALTEHKENEIRKLLEHVGLEWENQCAEFHETKRVVQTASAIQVRQKMYQGGSEQWRNYEKHLQPMIELLRNL